VEGVGRAAWRLIHAARHCWTDDLVAEEFAFYGPQAVAHPKTDSGTAGSRAVSVVEKGLRRRTPSAKLYVERHSPPERQSRVASWWPTCVRPTSVSIKRPGLEDAPTGRKAAGHARNKFTTKIEIRKSGGNTQRW